MDDKPVIEYHPFGTLTVHFDDVSITLRRCRLGDLEHAKNLLEELRLEIKEEREQHEKTVADLLNVVTAPLADPTDETARQTRRDQIRQFNDALDRIQALSRPLVYKWLSSVIERMGNNPAPKDMKDWPLDLLDGLNPGLIINHWQTRPLASGRPNPNGAADDSKPLTLSPPTVSSPLAPPPR